MKMPRDISGQELIKQFKKLGYSVTRQSGSHIRLTTSENGEHHITIPNHSQLKSALYQQFLLLLQITSTKQKMKL